MKRVMIGLAAAPLLVAAGVVLAQDSGRGPMNPFPEVGARHRGHLSAEDRQAFAEARIAALHAGLRLTADQEKLWPPVEEAMRGVAKQRMEARDQMRERFASLREGGGGRDLPAELRAVADRRAASAAAIGKLADASGPLYASLDEGQKRRLAMMTRFMQPWMGGSGGGRHGPHRGEGGR